MVRTRSVGLAGVELMGVQHVPLVEVAVLVRDPLEVEGHLHTAEVILGGGHCVLVYFDQLAQGRVVCHRPQRGALFLCAIENLEVLFVVRHLNFK